LEAKQGQDWLPERTVILKVAAANHLTVVDIAQMPAWNALLYRSDAIHPTTAGNVVLAEILADAIDALQQSKSSP
jgi:lysophospholipase L1-like esterase